MFSGHRQKGKTACEVGSSKVCEQSVPFFNRIIMQIRSWFGQNMPDRNPHVYNACTNSNAGLCLTPGHAFLDKCVNSYFEWQ